MPQIGSFITANLVEKEEVYQPVRQQRVFDIHYKIRRLLPRYLGDCFFKDKPVIQLRGNELAICFQQ